MNKDESEQKITRNEALLKEFDIEGISRLSLSLNELYSFLMRQIMTMIIVETRVKEMKAFAGDLQLQFRTQLQLELMKLPSSIRNMKMDEFVKVYRADLKTVARTNAKRRVRTQEAKPAQSETKNILATVDSLLSQINQLNSANSTDDVAKKLEEMKNLLSSFSTRK